MIVQVLFNHAIGELVKGRLVSLHVGKHISLNSCLHVLGNCGHYIFTYVDKTLKQIYTINVLTHTANELNIYVKNN